MDDIQEKFKKLMNEENWQIQKQSDSAAMAMKLHMIELILKERSIILIVPKRDIATVIPLDIPVLEEGIKKAAQTLEEIRKKIGPK